MMASPPRLLPCLLLLLAAGRGALALDNGAGVRPQRGWNSWNFFGCAINSSVVRGTADAFVRLGLRRHGYDYVVVDDCWAKSRDAAGNIQADPASFPEGMEELASYVHASGLKFGLYSDAGNLTCAGRPGSLGHETADARSYASWGVDYFKYDNCNAPAAEPPEKRYAVMRDALNATGREIFYSLCDWGVDNPATWGPRTGNSWRTTRDIKDTWDSVTSNLDENDRWAAHAGPGAWNDPDMLEVGNGGLTADEEVSHFSLWALAKAPLLIGCDLRTVEPRVVEVLTNDEVLALHADPLGMQGRKILANATGVETWGVPLAGGAYAAVLFNRSPAPAPATLDFARLGFNGLTTYEVRDLWAHATVGRSARSYSPASPVPAHGVVVLKLTPQQA